MGNVVELPAATKPQAMLLTHNAFLENWGVIRGLLNKGKSAYDGYYHLEDFAKLVILGSLHPWLFMRGDEVFGLSLVEILDFPKGRKARILFYAGTDPEAAMAATTNIEAWARQIGANELQIVGRLGWQKMGQEQGFKPLAVTLSKPIAPKTLH